MKIIDCVQLSPEWLSARCGKVTASEFSSVLAKGQGKTRFNYMYKLLAERLSGQSTLDGFISKSILRGIDIEDQARANYELSNCVDVSQVGFVEHDENIGGSPDGLIGSDGAVEIKCPDSHTHISYLLNGFPSIYKAQVQGNLWVCERDWLDFVSYDDRLKSNQLMVMRIRRDEKYISNLKEEVYRFVDALLIYENSLSGDMEKLLNSSILQEGMEKDK